MGFKDMLRRRATAAMAEATAPGEPYTGDARPRGTLGAMPIPGALELDLPAGKVKVSYWCKGKPAGVRGSDTGAAWDLPSFEFEIMPASEGTQRLAGRMTVPDMPMQVILPIGWSHKTFFVLDVPEPGGRYRAAITTPVYDDEAHVRFKD